MPGDGRVREEGVTEADAKKRVLEALDSKKRVLLVQQLAVRGVHSATKVSPKVLSFKEKSFGAT